jgi:hypothetical protein
MYSTHSFAIIQYSKELQPNILSLHNHIHYNISGYAGENSPIPLGAVGYSLPIKMDK